MTDSQEQVPPPLPPPPAGRPRFTPPTFSRPAPPPPPVRTSTGLLLPPAAAPRPEVPVTPTPPAPSATPAAPGPAPSRVAPAPRGLAPAHRAPGVPTDAPVLTPALAPAPQTFLPPEPGKPGKAGKTKPARDKAASAQPKVSTTGRRMVVPPPGGKLSNGRGANVATRAAFTITGLLLLVAVVAAGGVVIGSRSTHPKVDAGFTTAQLAQYGLTTFPTAEAASFAERYARLCETFDPSTATARSAAIAAVSTSGVDPACGWNGTGSQTVAQASFNGYSQPIADYPEHGRYLGVAVTLTTGTTFAVTVPVYVADLEHGTGMRAVGPIGDMPATPVATSVPAINNADSSLAHTDTTLGAQLVTTLFTGYFTAWGASDTVSLARFTTADATAAATAGLAGTLSAPQVTSAAVLLPASSGSTPSYTVGEKLTANVTVGWTTGGGAGVTRTYRVGITNTAQGWFVDDIGGGTTDLQGVSTVAPTNAAVLPSPASSLTPPAPASVSTSAPAQPTPSATPKAKHHHSVSPTAHP